MTLRPAALMALAASCCACAEAPIDEPIPDPVPPWPAWALSHWVWEDESTQESATALVDDYLAHDIPVGAIIIDSPWETGYDTFAWDPVRFPDPHMFFSAQLGAFCPLMENGGGGEHRPWAFDDETTWIYRRFVLLHEALGDGLTGVMRGY